MAQIQPKTPIFESYIAQEKRYLEDEAAQLPYGPQKMKLQRSIEQLEIAAHVNDWLSSPGLKPPR